MPGLHADDATERAAALAVSFAGEIEREMRLVAMNRRKAGMNGENVPEIARNAPAVHAAIPAVRRNRLAMRASAAYSSFHRSTPINERKDRTMKATSTQMRLTSLLLAVLTSAIVLGATVTGMQPSAADSHDVVVLEQATVKPTAVQ